MSDSSISHESAQDLKRTALAFHEADQHLRVAGDTTEGVVEAAATDYLEKRAAHQDAIATCEAEADAEAIAPEDAPHTDEAEDVAAGPDADATLGKDGEDKSAEEPSDSTTSAESKSGEAETETKSKKESAKS